MFNVGEIVRIRDDVASHAAHGWNPEMRHYIGCVMTIASFNGYDTYRLVEDNGRWAWGESDFELVDAKKIKEKNEEIRKLLMDKSKLKEKWGQYCDTDKLVDDMMALLTTYNHTNSEHGVCTILNEYFTKKEPLIKMFAQSPNYKGDMRIITKEEFERENVASEIAKFVRAFKENAGVADCILKYKDKDGKTLYDYIQTKTTHMKLKDMAKATNILASKEVSAFSQSGATMESEETLGAFIAWMRTFERIHTPTLSNDLQADKISLKAGTKTSRAFNKICTNFGVDKWSRYNKEFAKYADMVSGKGRELYFIISLNPLDYLTMSFGKSWASCHTIDKENRRRAANGYSGAYCNGTLSYMMDESSIITYVLTSLSDKLHEEGKLYRNMFHCKGKKFIQARIYPQGNDGSVDLYKKFRFIVQRELFSLLGLEENKWKSRGVEGRDHDSFGRHYRDYIHFSDCKTFYPAGHNDSEMISIGHVGLCPHCGRETDYSDRLSHSGCAVPKLMEVPVEEEVVRAVDEIAVTAGSHVDRGTIIIDTSHPIMADDWRADRSYTYTYTTSGWDRPVRIVFDDGTAIEG